jgi:hypothetical protein
MRLDPAIIKHQIENLLIQCPDLEDDDILRADMIEAETEAFDFLRTIEERRREAIAMAGACATTIAELEVRRDRFTRREKAMRALAFKVMEAGDIRKPVELPEATYSIRNGTPKVIITDEQLIPDLLCRIKREPDKKRIGEMLKDGKEVRGAELSNAEPTLAIRTK